MPRKRSRESSLSSPTCRKSLRLSASVLRSTLERRQASRQSISPKSSESSILSSPPHSEELDDPFKKAKVDSTPPSTKRTAHEDNAPLDEAPTTRATAEYRTPDKKRRVHFLDEDQDAKASDPVAHRPQIAFLPGLGTPFELTAKSIFAKPDDSGKQRAWIRKYISARDRRTEVLDTRQAALGPELGGSRASTPASFVSNTPSKRGRGNGRRGRGRGRGGRGRGGGRAGRNEDSPEPPKKKILTEEEKEILADLKARQTELKKFFKDVGAQQNQALSLLATRDLTKIAKKSKAHEKVPEHQVLLDDLDKKKEEAEDFAKKKYEYDLEQASFLLEAGKEAIERRFRTRCEQAQSEHHAGARGDCLIAMEAIQAMIDDNRTEAGSTDQTRFPRFHLFAQPGMVRGYYSQHVTDETALHRPLSSFDDTIRRPVLDHDVVSPTLFKALDLPRAHQAEDASQQVQDSSTVSSPSLESNQHETLSFQALADEAIRRIKESNEVTTAAITQVTHPQPPTIPKPPQQDPNLGSWPLSRLADAAEHESTRRKQQVTQNSHIFPPPPRMVPVDPFQPWLGFMPEPLPMAPPNHRHRNIQWPPQQQQQQQQQQRMPMTMPPPPSSLPSYTISHPLPPPPPPPQQQQQQQLQPPLQFIQRHQQLQPQLQPQQQQQQLNMPSYPIQQPQPQPQPQPRSQKQSHQNRQPVTFVNHTLHAPHPMLTPTPAPAPAKSRKGTGASDRGTGAGASAGMRAGPPPPPKGGQRLLLPKKSGA